MTRRDGVCQAPIKCRARRLVHLVEDRAAQPVCVSVRRMGRPGADARDSIIICHRTRAQPVAHATQAIAEAHDIAFRQSPPSTGKQHEPEKLGWHRGWHHECLSGVKLQTPSFKKRRHPRAPDFQFLLRVRKQGEMVERIQIAIGEKLAGQITDGQTAPPRHRRKKIVTREM